jgi:parallel beta-helix repeat protein
MALTKVTYSMIAGEVANALDFGAVGDGTTDDTVAIQAAVNSGKPVYFPSGTYLIAAPILLPDNAILQSDNGVIKASASFSGTGYTYKAMITTAQTGTNTGLIVRGLTIDGNSVSGIFGILAFACNDLVIDGNLIEDCAVGIADYGDSASLLNQRIVGNTIHGGANGLQVSAVDGRNIVVSKNYVYDHTSSGMAIQSSNEILIEENTCTNNGTTNGNGIFIKGCQSIRVIGNYCHLNSYTAEAGSAIGINMTGAFVNKNISIIGNVLSYSGDDGIDAYCESGASNIDITIQGNVIVENKRSGINVSTDGGASVQRGYVITGNVIHTNGFHGVQLQDANYCTVTGNSIYDNSTFNPGNYVGIYGEDLLNSTVTGNTIYQSAGVQNGIIFDGTPVNNRVTDNTVSSTSIAYSLNNPANNNYIIDYKGSAAPVAGRYEVGDIVYNSAPTAGGFIGFVCVTAGTPGTWKTFGAISA